MTVADIPVGDIFLLPYTGIEVRKVSAFDPLNPKYCSAETLGRVKELWHVPLGQPVKHEP